MTSNELVDPFYYHPFHLLFHFLVSMLPLSQQIDIGAVLSATGCAVVARGDDDVVFYNDSAVMLAQAGASFGHRLCDVEIIIDFIRSFHDNRSPCSGILYKNEW